MPKKIEQDNKMDSNMQDEELKEILEKIRSRLGWICFWLFLIACSVLDLSNYIAK